MVLVGAVAMAMVGLSAWAGNVWEDATDIYYNDWRDANNNGKIDAGEYRNDRDPSRASGNTLVYNPDANCPLPTGTLQKQYTVRNESVRVLGENGITYSEEPCLHFTSYADTTEQPDGSLVTNKLHETFMQFHSHITGDNYTILMRFKPEFNNETAAEKDRVLLWTGPSNNKDGIVLYYRTNPKDTGGYLIAKNVGGQATVGNAELMITNGVWADIAVIAASNHIELAVRHEQLYRKDDRAKVWSSETGNGEGGRRFTWLKSATYDPVATDKRMKPPYPYHRFANDWSWTGRNPGSCGYTAGSLHTIAFWDRALTRSEVYEFFSSGRPALMRVGPGGKGTAGAKWMLGAAGTATTIDARPCNWKNLPSKLVKGAPVSVNFTVPVEYAGLPQLVKVMPASDSASGEVTVSLDGAVVAKLSVVAAKPEFAYIDKAVFTAGAHVFTIERTDNGAGDLKLNSYDLTGSWQLGKDDGIYSQTRTRDDFTSSHVFAWAQYGYCPASPSAGWACDYPAFFGRCAHYPPNAKENYVVKWEIPVDEDLLAANYRLEYSLKSAGLVNQYNQNNWKATQSFNGDAFSWEFTPPYAKGTVFKHLFDPMRDSALHGGDNVITSKVEAVGIDDATAYNFQPYVDYYRMTVYPPSQGLIIVVQ